MKSVIWTILFSFAYLMPFIVHGQAISNSTSGAVVNQAAGNQVAPIDMDIGDDERHLSQTYVDELGSQKMKLEKCALLKDSAACRGRGKGKFLGLDSDIIKLLAKAYSTVVPAIGGKFTKKTSSGGEEKKSKDYCQYIATATEAVAQFKQQMDEKVLTDLPPEQRTRQKDMLYKAANSHKMRSETHKIQSYGWGATSVCYTAYIAQGFMNWQVFAKMGASGVMAWFFHNEAKTHMEFYTEVKAIADELPGVGDCNPVTERSCFCAKEKYSAGDLAHQQKYCAPYLHNRKIANDSYRVPCVGADLQADAQCTCLDTNSCFDKTYFSELKSNLPGFLGSSVASGFGSLARGELKAASLASGTTGLAARAKSLVALNAKKATSLPLRNLSPSEARQARLAQKLGAPKVLASLLAQQPATSFGKSKVAGIRKNYNNARQMANYSNRRKRSNVMRFSGGKGALNSKRSSGQRYGKKYGKSKARSKNGKMMKFAEQAAAQADITKDKGAGIFEIISNRYQRSGWRRLEVDQ